MSYQSFASEWLGKRVDTDGVPAGEVYQCVDLVKQYLSEEFGIPQGAYGNAIDYWNKPASAITAHFDKIGTNRPVAGDIVIFNGLPGNSNGHIGIATGSINSGAVCVLEQNGSDGSGNGQGGNAIRYRYITQNRIAGVLRPKSGVTLTAAQVPAPASQTQFVKITGDYRTWYSAPGQPTGVKLEPNRLGGGQLTYKVLDRQGDYVKIERQDGSGQGWIYVGASGGADTLTSFFSA